MVYELKSWKTASLPVVYDVNNWSIDVELTVSIIGDTFDFCQLVIISVIIPNATTFGTAAGVIQAESVIYVDNAYNS